MTEFVALLRGVNVGGRQKVPMADLRALLGELGHADVRTHLQSGNAIFGTDRTDTDKIAEEIEQGIAREMGLPAIGCLVFNREYLRRVVDENPLSDIATEPAKLLAIFLSEPPAAGKLRAIDADAYKPDVFAPGKQEIYVWYPDGIRNSKLTHAFFQKKLGCRIATGRNWNTVNALLNKMN
ncbi:DUF1697 domain-containing protein [Actinoallomurus bryophytorum]|uniref:Uncharacterized protein (DUF1697 family) n=1 Tax=Actinoallomurus bryophytorum TaxID=1490222 RepID=A0A543CWY0_9ACTN|nr:DUF1697 domain-containing protein [Actinoallomurus bryophytorum]TQM01539.1 uncharacterized protein (DUF1697 family) [Actinoallomurus bryophytorum]